MDKTEDVSAPQDPGTGLARGVISVGSDYQKHLFAGSGWCEGSADWDTCTNCKGEEN